LRCQRAANTIPNPKEKRRKVKKEENIFEKSWATESSLAEASIYYTYESVENIL
jgi:hypothetical protein